MALATSAYLNRPPRALSDLKPKQIDWLKANVPSFATAKQQADAAIAHAAEVAERIRPS